MIEVKNISKKYGNNYAVKDLSFSVGDGEILGFLGPNGAGKSTTMNILTGYISATEGSATINGIDILDNPIEAKKLIGYLPEIPPLYIDMTVKAYLEFMFDLKKIKLPKTAHINEVCKVTKIDNVFNRLIKHLSKGYRQRVGLAQALLGNPPVLVLDEPTVGLDPNQIIEIRNLIKKLGKGHTVILSSHILSEVQSVCDRVVVINNGQIVANDTPDNLSKNLVTDHKLIVRILGPEKDVTNLIKKIPQVEKVETLGMREKNAYDYNIECSEGSDIRVELFNRLAQRNWPILTLKNSEMSLEDIFLYLTTPDNNIDKKGGKN